MCSQIRGTREIESKAGWIKISNLTINFNSTNNTNNSTKNKKKFSRTVSECIHASRWNFHKCRKSSGTPWTKTESINTKFNAIYTVVKSWKHTFHAFSRFRTFRIFLTFRRFQSWDKISSIYGLIFNSHISQQSTSTQPNNTNNSINNKKKFSRIVSECIHASGWKSISALNQAGQHLQTESVES